VPLGQWSQVTLRVTATCPFTQGLPLHVVLVLDSSGSMAGEKNAQLKKAVKTMIKGLDLPGHPQIEMGIVKFASVANTLCQLTNDGGRLGSCANKVDANGGTAIDAGIKEGLKVLTRGRPRGADDGAIREVMVVLSDGANNAGCAPVLSAAAQAKGQRVLLMTVCVGADCDAQCMRQAASSPRHAYVSDSAGLITVFEGITGLLSDLAGEFLRSMTITDELAANMRLVPDSTLPAPSSITGQTLVWRLDYPTLALTITYWVQPQALGDHPVSVAADGLLVDSLGRQRTFPFPNLILHVVDLPALPTPTAFPTWTPTPARTERPPAPTATPIAPRLCASLAGRVPDAVMAAAMANPERIGGWGKPCSPNLPPGPSNPARQSLSLQQPSKPYHPLFNGLEFKCGCP
jgi:uncharacterized protein YegL